MGKNENIGLGKGGDRSYSFFDGDRSFPEAIKDVGGGKREGSSKTPSWATVKSRQAGNRLFTQEEVAIIVEEAVKAALARVNKASNSSFGTELTLSGK